MLSKMLVKFGKRPSVGAAHVCPELTPNLQKEGQGQSGWGAAYQGTKTDNL